ncbi:MAG: hypothetical protein JJE34_05035 [Alphaproteobacteria bacterium]|nr:hypothetical protein [Alphaproteobacteria bacterium]
MRRIVRRAPGHEQAKGQGGKGEGDEALHGPWLYAVEKQCATHLRPGKDASMASLPAHP